MTLFFGWMLSIISWNDNLLYVLSMSRTLFRVNPHSVFAWMSRNSLLETVVDELIGCWFESNCGHLKTSDFAPVSSKEVLDIQAIIECGFTLKHTDKCTVSNHNTAQSFKKIRPVWLNGWVFTYELSGCGFESSYSHLNFRFWACFAQGITWHSSGNYRVWIYSETRPWHKNIQSNGSYR